MKEALEIMIQQVKEQMIKTLQEEVTDFGTTNSLNSRLRLLESLLAEKFRDVKFEEGPNWDGTINTITSL